MRATMTAARAWSRVRRLAPVAVGLLFFVPQSGDAQSVEVFRRVAESIVKVEADDSVATGFLWTDATHAVTSLHVVDGRRRITVHYVTQDGRIAASTAAVVERVLKESDLVLLRLENPQNRRPLVASPGTPAVKQSLDALGFPLNTPGYSNTEVKVRFGGNQLRSILPPKVLARLTDYPSVTIEILNLEGNLVPGLSGAPIINAEGNVVGIADGGLEEGAVGICWGIPVSHLQRLVQSSVTQVPGARHVVELFAADLRPAVTPTKRLGAFGLTKLRSRTYEELAGTADDRLGLAQLTMFFRMFNPGAFRYDVYQDLASGATVVVPEGAHITADGDFAVVRTDDSRMSMKLQIKPLTGPEEAQQRALAFERELTELDGRSRIDPDPSWSYLQPMTRFGVTVIRRAYLRSVPQGWQWAPQKYYFETLATNGRALLAVAAVNDDSSAPVLQLETMCAQGYADPRCPELIRTRRTWAQMVLGVQFSSFPLVQF